MNNDTTNKAAAAFAFINGALAEGRTVYVSTMLRCIEISPKVVAKFVKAGVPLFKMTEAGLRIAHGKTYNLIATPSMMLVGITAR